MKKKKMAQTIICSFESKISKMYAKDHSCLVFNGDVKRIKSFCKENYFPETVLKNFFSVESLRKNVFGKKSF